jgi:hypothetical protein
MRRVLIVGLVGCAHAPQWQPPAPAVVVDRGSFEYDLEGAPSQPGGNETFAIADRPDGSHLIHADISFTRHGVTRSYGGTLVVDPAWRPISGSFAFRGGSPVELGADGGKLTLHGGGSSLVEASPSDIFTGADTFILSALLQPLCSVRGQHSLTVFPDKTITVDASVASGDESRGLPIHDQLILVSVNGADRYELACDGKKLVVIDAPGSIGVRPGYEAVAKVLIQGLGPLHN